MEAWQAGQTAASGVLVVLVVPSFPPAHMLFPFPHVRVASIPHVDDQDLCGALPKLAFAAAVKHASWKAGTSLEKVLSHIIRGPIYPTS